MATTNYKQQSELAKKYFAQGLAEGEALGQAKAILVVLGARGVAFSPEARERIATCNDLALLEHWLRRAATCANVDELFAD
jgi:hypothetical protein